MPQAFAVQPQPDGEPYPEGKAEKWRHRQVARSSASVGLVQMSVM